MTFTRRTGMRSRWAAALGALAMAIAVSGPAAVDAQSVADIEVEIDPVTAEVLLGESVDLEVRVTNRTEEPTPPLVVHIDITDPSQSSSVDPEDWTATLSKGVGVIEPGMAKTVKWTVQPISGGQFALYAVALTPGGPDVTSSNVLTFDVTEQRSLNPEGILPVAIGGPVLIGGIWLVQARLARRQDAFAAG